MRAGKRPHFFHRGELTNRSGYRVGVKGLHFHGKSYVVELTCCSSYHRAFVCALPNSFGADDQIHRKTPSLLEKNQTFAAFTASRLLLDLYWSLKPYSNQCHAFIRQQNVEAKCHLCYRKNIFQVKFCNR